MREDVMVEGLWDRQVDAITDVKIGDADTDSYKYESMAALLARWEIIKKDKRGKHCHDQQKQIALCSLSGSNSREGNPGHDISIELRHVRGK